MSNQTTAQTRSDWSDLGFTYWRAPIPDARAASIKAYVYKETGEELLDVVDVGAPADLNIMAERPRKSGVPSFGDIVDLRRRFAEERKSRGVRRLDEFMERYGRYHEAVRTAEKALDVEPEALIVAFATAYALSYWLAGEWFLIQEKV